MALCRKHLEELIGAEVLDSYTSSFFYPAHYTDFVPETLSFPRIKDYWKRPTKIDIDNRYRVIIRNRDSKREWIQCVPLPKLDFLKFIRRVMAGRFWTLTTYHFNTDDFFLPNFVQLDLDCKKPEQEDEFWGQVQTLQELEAKGLINILWTTSPGNTNDSGQHRQGLYAHIKFNRDYPPEQLNAILNPLLPALHLDCEHNYDKDARLTRLPGQPWVVVCNPDPSTRSWTLEPPDADFLKAYTEQHKSSQPDRIERLASWVTFAKRWHSLKPTDLQTLVDYTTPLPEPEPVHIEVEDVQPSAVQVVEPVEQVQTDPEPTPVEPKEEIRLTPKASRQDGKFLGWTDKTQEDLLAMRNTFWASIKSGEYSRLTYSVINGSLSVEQAEQTLFNHIRKIRPTTSETCYVNPNRLKSDVHRILKHHLNEFDPTKGNRKKLDPTKEEQDKKRFLPFVTINKDMLLAKLHNKGISKEAYSFVADFYYDAMMKYNGRVAKVSMLGYFNNDEYRYRLVRRELSRLGLMNVLSSHSHNKHHCRQYGLDKCYVKRCSIDAHSPKGVNPLSNPQASSISSSNRMTHNLMSYVDKPITSLVGYLNGALNGVDADNNTTQHHNRNVMTHTAIDTTPTTDKLTAFCGQYDTDLASNIAKVQEFIRTDMGIL